MAEHQHQQFFATADYEDYHIFKQHDTKPANTSALISFLGLRAPNFFIPKIGLIVLTHNMLDKYNMYKHTVGLEKKSPQL